MEIEQEEINKLLLDPSFRNWSLNSNKEDFEKWENFLKGESALIRIAQQAKKIIIQVELSESKQAHKDIVSFERLLVKRKSESSKSPSIREDLKTRSRWISFNHLVKIAAVLSFILVFSGLLYFTADSDPEQPVQVVVETVKKQTQNGQHLTITLPDGSKVKLNSNSSISYSKEFFKNRKVELEGEAFFSVVRDESSPFVVKTADFQTEVLGTSFNVYAYKNTEAKVSVTSGKVKVSQIHSDSKENIQTEVLGKEEAIIISNNEFKESAYNLDEILWKDGILVFSNESIQTISSKIERWFNVSVTINNGTNIAGDFSGKYSNESLEEILTGMGYALEFSFKMEGNEIIINGKN